MENDALVYKTAETQVCSACGGTSEEVAPIHTDNTETNKLAPYLSITRLSLIHI